MVLRLRVVHIEHPVLHNQLQTRVRSFTVVYVSYKLLSSDLRLTIGGRRGFFENFPSSWALLWDGDCRKTTRRGMNCGQTHIYVLSPRAKNFLSIYDPEYSNASSTSYWYWVEDIELILLQIRWVLYRRADLTRSMRRDKLRRDAGNPILRKTNIVFTLDLELLDFFWNYIVKWKVFVSRWLWNVFKLRLR